MKAICLDDYASFLRDMNFASTSDYKSGIKAILNQEKVEFDAFVKHLAFFKYKYKYIVNDYIRYYYEFANVISLKDIKKGSASLTFVLTSVVISIFNHVNC